MLAILVAFHPGPDFEQVVRAARAEADGLFVWDNTPGAGAGGPPPAAVPGVEWVRSPVNVGLPKAYNAGLRFAEGHGFEFLLLLDQDSELTTGTVARLRHDYGQLQSADPVGAIGARNIERVPTPYSPKPAFARLLESHYERLYRSGALFRDGELRERWSVTNSGLLARVDALRAVGGFDEDLFLDAVDYDLAERLRDRRFRLFQDTGAQLRHSQGTLTEVRIAGSRFATRGYDARRTEHLVRDTTICARRWWRSDPSFAIGISVSMWVGTLGAIAILPRRGERVRRMFEGFRSALRLPRRSPLPPAEPLG